MTRITAPWLTDPAVQQVFALFSERGETLFAVGGCVRNSLLGRPVSDIDMASAVRPEEVLSIAEAAGLRAIPTGIDHGTVTILVDGKAFEITTFRADVETDGRHAKVHFSSDLETDARRRDFTMNALYARADGSVIDSVGGLKDLEARVVRFIGDAAERLREDYLRALRYFRFHAWYGAPENGTDPEALAAIAAHLDGLAQLSKERITAELLKLLAAEDPAPALAAMGQVGVLQALFGGGDPVQVARVVHAADVLGLQTDPLLRLAALSLPHPETDLRLSRAQAQHLATLRKAQSDVTAPGALGYHLGATAAAQVLALRSATFETPPVPAELEDVQRGAAAVFPIKAADLMPALQGPALGTALKRLEAEWVASGFLLSREALLNLL